jgi:H+/Cl- antiporter ClcA
VSADGQPPPNSPPSPGLGPVPFVPPPRFYPPPPGSYGYAHAPQPTSNEAVAALVCGIGAWVCAPLAFAAIYLGVRVRRETRGNPQLKNSDQMALAGIILGAICGGIQVLMFLLYFGVFVVALAVQYVRAP